MLRASPMLARQQEEQVDEGEHDSSGRLTQGLMLCDLADSIAVVREADRALSDSLRLAIWPGGATGLEVTQLLLERGGEVGAGASKRMRNSGRAFRRRGDSLPTGPASGHLREQKAHAAQGMEQVREVMNRPAPAPSMTMMGKDCVEKPRGARARTDRQTHGATPVSLSLGGAGTPSF